MFIYCYVHAFSLTLIATMHCMGVWKWIACRHYTIGKSFIYYANFNVSIYEVLMNDFNVVILIEPDWYFTPEFSKCICVLVLFIQMRKYRRFLAISIWSHWKLILLIMVHCEFGNHSLNILHKTDLSKCVYYMHTLFVMTIQLLRIFTLKL